MDNKELLRGVIDAIINEDEGKSKELFSAYSTQKTKGLLEGAATKAKKDKKDETECTPEEVAADVTDKANKDD